jgi:hypothetical protein
VIAHGRWFPDSSSTKTGRHMAKNIAESSVKHQKSNLIEERRRV